MAPRYLSFTAASSAALRIYCYAGTVKVDDVHLEKAAADGSGNLLEASDFSRLQTLSRWTGTGFGASDGLSDGAVLITASPSASKTLYQDVPIGREASVTGFVLSAKAEGQTVPEKEGRVFELGLTIFYTDGTEESFSENFNYDTAGLQYKSMAVRPSDGNLEKTIEKVRYIIRFSNTAGQMAFSDPVLQIDETGVCYRYDSNGNVISTSMLRERDEAYTYSNADELLSLNRSGEALSENYSYTYDSTYVHRLLSARSSQTGLGACYSYDVKGNNTEVSIGTVRSDGTLDTTRPYLRSNKGYSTDRNYLTSVTDFSGNRVSYFVSSTSGLINAISDGEGRSTSLSYNPTTQALSSVSAGGMTVSYAYGSSDHRLSGISHNGFSYQFSYDPFGNLSAVTAGGNTLVTNSYLPNNGSLSSVSYGNGDEILYTYDALGRVSTETRGTDVYSYRYNARGYLGTVLKNNVICEEFFYDLSDRLISVKNGTMVVNFVYDGEGRLADAEYYYFQNSTDPYRYTTSYGADDRVEGVSLEGGAEVCYTYDRLNRISEKEVRNGDLRIIKTEYGYENRYLQYTTTRIKSYTNRGPNGQLLSAYQYAYDASGNITNVYFSDGSQADYYYDDLNRLETSVWTEPDMFQYYYRYFYDDGGNLLSKQLLLCGEEDWDVVQEDVYSYASTGWKDLLVEFNGETITYDAIGNPLSYYGGRSFTWEGRELKTLTNGDTTASYVYNESGIRTSKTVDGVTTSYLLEGSRIIFQTVGSTRWSFLYYGDELTGFEVEGETYYYLKNLQGDIVGILDEDGEVVVEYLYDDWGELLSIEGELSDTVGEENPFRYRGYYFDSESGLYYLNSRYYDPETGRFISADILIVAGSDVMGANLFAYCGDNPVMGCDPMGDLDWGEIFDLVITVISLGGGATVGILVYGLLISSGVSPAEASLIAFASGASTTGIINNAVNAIYYNNYSSENSDLEQDPKKSDYVDEGYISRWRRLDYTKTITHEETYNLNAWRFYSEYSAHMYVWFVSGWADEKSIPLISNAAGRANKAEILVNDWDSNKEVVALTIVFGGLGL